MSNAIPIQDIFRHRAQGVGHLVRGHLEGFDGFSADEDLEVYLKRNDDGSQDLIYKRKHNNAAIGFININAAGIKNLKYGEETIHKSQDLGSLDAEYMNNGYEAVDVDMRDLFSESKGEEKSDSSTEGISESVTVSSEQSIEGCASFSEEVSTEVSAEFTQESSTSKETTKETEGETHTSVPAGKGIRVVESRSRADGDVEVAADAEFTFMVTIGPNYHGGGFHKGHHHSHTWDNWSDFCDVIHGDAPDNWPMAPQFKDHPPYHADLWALAPLAGKVRSRVAFTGRVVRKYSVERL